jgi:hypothetical protein
MEVLIRAIPHHYFEHEMGHCSMWPLMRTDAISCTYNMDGFTPMNAVLSELGLDREYFRKRANMHEGKKFQVILHGEEKPFFITTTKTECWDSEPDATGKILKAADAARCESLCMTHFAFVLGSFPKEAFAHCLRKAEQNKKRVNLKKSSWTWMNATLRLLRSCIGRQKCKLPRVEK